MEARDFNESLKTLEVIKLPTTSSAIILPDVMVAEIIQPRHSELTSDGPDWLVGHCRWRGHSIPMICFEAMNQANYVTPSEVLYVAVINSLSKHGYLPYYGIVLSELPSASTIERRTVTVHDGRARGRAETLSVLLEGESAGIPNINWIEQHLLGYILHYNK